MYTYLLDVYQFGKPIAEKKQRRRRLYMYAEEYEWDAIPTSSLIEQAQAYIAQNMQDLQRFASQMAGRQRIDQSIQYAIIEKICKAGRELLKPDYKFNWGQLQSMHPEYLKPLWT